MSLSDWLKINNISQAAFGAMFNPMVLQNHVSRWLSGTSRVTLDQAIQIEHLTDGWVTPHECLDMHVLSAFSVPTD